jgi:2-isopropylmalate synthase
MRPEDVGVPATTLVLGKHSGRHALQHRAQSLGVELSRLELDRLYRRVIALADAQKTVSDAELLDLVEQQRTPREPAHAIAPHQPRHGTAQEEVGYGHGV